MPALYQIEADRPRRRATRTAAATAATFAAALVSGTGQPAPPDPFEFFRQTVEFSASDREKMRRREVIVKVLPASDDELAVIAASAIDTTADRLVAKVQDIATLRKSDIVPAIARFSATPRISDLSDLRLDAGDVDEVADCAPGDCGLKLSAAEMERLRRAAAGSAGAAIQREFREIVLDRVLRYQERGLDGLPPMHDHDLPVAPAEVFDRLLEKFEMLQRPGASVLARQLRRFPEARQPEVTEFLYWAVETYAPKPIVTARQVNILRTGLPPEVELLMADKQIFATHYLDGMLGVTALLHDPATGTRYLAYLNRSSVDILTGFAAGLRRFILESRVDDRARAIFAEERRRIEGE